MLVFYGLACLIVCFYFYCFLKRKQASFIYAILVTYVTTEFWELPLFTLEYLGVTPVNFMSIINNIIIGIMAMMLLVTIRFRLDKVNGSILLSTYIANSLILYFPPTQLNIHLTLHIWLYAIFPRILALVSLSYIVMRELKKKNDYLTNGFADTSEW